MFSNSIGAGRDCRKISWFYHNNNNNQEFYWSGYGPNWNQNNVTYTNVILNKY